MELEQRIMLWGFPRSLTTVFEKCVSFVPDIQIINEPYNCAATFGPEGFSQTGHVEGMEEFDQFVNRVNEEITENAAKYTHGWQDDECTFEWVKRTLEKDYPNKRYIFCKDFIFNIFGRFDMIPQGYQHTFLIRDPKKLFLSNRNLTVSDLPPDEVEQFKLDQVPSWQMYPKTGYGELLDFIRHFRNQGVIQPHPVIIDADDLQNHPASVLRQYCQAVGLPYDDSLLTWEEGDACVLRNWRISKSYLAANQMVGFYETAFSSCGFHPAKDLPDTIPDDVLRLAKNADPYYQELYKMCIKP